MLHHGGWAKFREVAGANPARSPCMLSLGTNKPVVCGGDGNQWVRKSFDRLQIKQEFLLDRFHLHRAARQAFQDRSAAHQMVTRFRQEDFQSVQAELSELIQQSDNKAKEKPTELFQYLYRNRDGLLDLEQRGISTPAKLSAIEGNVDKIVVHRMKGRGCSWRLSGLRTMLALCRNAEQLGAHAYSSFPLRSSHKGYHQRSKLTVEFSEAFQGYLCLFFMDRISLDHGSG